MANKRRRKKTNNRNVIGQMFRMVISFVLVFSLAFAVNYLMKNMKNISADNDATETQHSEKTIKEYANKMGYSMDDYPENIRKLFKKNKETKDFVLEYPEKKGQVFDVDFRKYRNTNEVPLFMQWDQRWGYYEYAGDCMGITGCGPTCLSMVAVYLTHNISYTPKYIADFAMDNGYADDEYGSAWTLISEGGKELGMDVTEITIDESRIESNLEVGNPIICVMGPGDFTSTGHFIVLTGYNDGKVSINDPNNISNSQKEWEFSSIKDQIKNLWVLR